MMFLEGFEIDGWRGIAGRHEQLQAVRLRKPMWTATGGPVGPNDFLDEHHTETDVNQDPQHGKHPTERPDHQTRTDHGW
jgi:hypothetical protein